MQCGQWGKKFKWLHQSAEPKSKLNEDSILFLTIWTSGRSRKWVIQPHAGDPKLDMSKDPGARWQQQVGGRLGAGLPQSQGGSASTITEDTRVRVVPQRGQVERAQYSADTRRASYQIWESWNPEQLPVRGALPWPHEVSLLQPLTGCGKADRAIRGTGNSTWSASHPNVPRTHTLEPVHLPSKQTTHIPATGLGGFLSCVQALSHVQLFETPWTAAWEAPLSSLFQSLLKFMSNESVTLSHHLIPILKWGIHPAQLPWWL